MIGGNEERMALALAVGADEAVSVSGPCDQRLVASFVHVDDDAEPGFRLSL
jgi:hypothetical protein